MAPVSGWMALISARNPFPQTGRRFEARKVCETETKHLRAEKGNSSQQLLLTETY